MSEYTESIPNLLQAHQVTPEKGLSDEQAAALLEQYGENRLEEGETRSFLAKFVDQLRDPMVLILLVAAVLAFVVALLENGEFIDSIVILAIVILNAFLGVRQESKAENALHALEALTVPTAKVVRDGALRQIPAEELVPGDILQLDAGDAIPADGRIVESAGLHCEESSLTGESLPVEKDPDAAVPSYAGIGDRLNMVYRGCSVTNGRAKILVTATGMDTEMGKIAGLLRVTQPQITPLQQKLATLGKHLGGIALIICAAIFVLGLWQGMQWLNIFMTAVSLAVAAIPEGLTAVVTVVLALGVQRMVKHNAIIRHLPAVETLGSASVICSDKTGTLTQNKMTVLQVWPAGREIESKEAGLSPESVHLLRLGAMCSDGRITQKEDGEYEAVGDPTETAIVMASLQAGMDKAVLDQNYPRVAEIPFDSTRKRMTTIHRMERGYLVVVKGGPDVLLPLCSGGTDQAEERNGEISEQALRVLAVACCPLEELPDTLDAETLEQNLTLMGLIGMMDPPREESARAVELCHKAGIRTVMITGDHVITAGAIAGEIGILREGDRSISGRELAELSDEELARDVSQYAVYARVSPQDKIRIVRAWQSRGDVVAMTGDGVNDAPALQAADIGCAMGITGTDVAKGAADMVLTDDNFATIVEAVRGGRGIYDNIRKTVQFLLGSNLGEVLAVFLAMVLGWGTPLLAIHLLLINVITDALPALALGVEPVESDVMNRRPIPRSQGIFAHGLGLIILLQGIMVGLLTLLGYWLGSNYSLSPLYPPSHAIGMTMAFLVLALSQLSQALNCRSRRSLFRVGWFSNKKMLQAVLASLVVILGICFLPPLASAFRIATLSMAHWIWVAALSLAPLLLVELVKLALYLRTRPPRIPKSLGSPGL